MAKSLNRWQGIGNVGKDPIVSYMPSGEAVAKLTLAVADDYKDKQGNKVEQTEWVPVVFFGKLAEIVQQYVHKGSKLYIEGKFTTRKYQDRQSGQDRYITEIRGENMQMLDTKVSNQRDNFDQGGLPPYAGTQPAAPQQQRQPATQAPADDWDDGSDIPF